MTFPADGHTLLSAGGDRTVRAWEADVEHAAERICATVSPPLSAPDWNRHFPDVDLTPPCRRPSSDRRSGQLHLVTHCVPLSSPPV
ncbi:hypothetical protein AB0M48_02105 [Lentzea sp. NPDC051208]|uniref:hypothetical protein n=1 Tax=Lentzea sp. NPDC051208 TaxID=3154642 RepID=UPI00342AD564